MVDRFKRRCRPDIFGVAAVVLTVIIGLGMAHLWDSHSLWPSTAQKMTSPDVATAALSNVYQDVVTNKSYSDLPSQIRSGLGYTSNEVKAVVYAEASLITKASSFVITVVDTISRLSGLIIGGAQSKKEVKQALESTMAQELISQGGTVGQVVVTLYKIDDAGNLIKAAVQTAKVAKGAASAPLIAAQAVSMVLDAEMTYINNNMSGGLKNLWTLNPFSTSRLKLYIVFVAAANKKGLEDVRGVRFYYYNDKTQSWVNHYNDLTGSDVMLKK